MLAKISFERYIASKKIIEKLWYCRSFFLDLYGSKFMIFSFLLLKNIKIKYLKIYFRGYESYMNFLRVTLIVLKIIKRQTHTILKETLVPILMSKLTKFI